MSKSTNTKKIIWLASYPCSGEVWFSKFLQHLIDEEDLFVKEFNSHSILTPMDIFENATDMSPEDLYRGEIENLLPDVFMHITRSSDKERLFIRTHEAYKRNSQGSPIIPKEATICAIYFMRNSFDIKASFDFSALPVYTQAPETILKEHQIEKWQAHIKSWTGLMPFPVMIIRFENLYHDTLKTCAKAIEFLNIQASVEQIEISIANTNNIFSYCNN